MKLNKYHLVWLKAYREQSEVKIECTSEEECTKLRFALYNAIRKHRGQETELGFAARDVELVRQGAKAFSLRHFTKRPAQAVIEQALRGPKILDKILGTEGEEEKLPEFTPNETVQEMARRALEKVEELGKKNSEAEEGSNPYYKR